MNRWNIPRQMETEVIERDKSCIYCGICFDPVPDRRGDRPTWEHIVNDARIVTKANIARCCASCNASKGARPLSVWLDSLYCAKRGITLNTLAPVAQAALASAPAYIGSSREI